MADHTDDTREAGAPATDGTGPRSPSVPPPPGPAPRDAANGPPGSFADFYLDSPYARFPQEHRSGDTLGVTMIDVRQDAIETVDPAIPAIAIVGFRGADNTPGELDIGDGWRAHHGRRGIIDPIPAHTECRLRIPAVHLLVFAIDHAALDARLDEVGAGAGMLDALANTCEPMPQALALMERAWDAAEATGPAANLIVDGAVSGVLGLMLARAGRSVAPAPRLDDVRLQRVVDYVEAHLAEPMNAGELAGVAHVSLFHFTRIFREATGRTPHAYVTARRVERAKGLLRDPRAALAQVAFACGFASQSHFGEVFRRHVGASPGAWRREAAR